MLESFGFASFLRQKAGEQAFPPCLTHTPHALTELQTKQSATNFLRLQLALDACAGRGELSTSCSLPLCHCLVSVQSDAHARTHTCLSPAQSMPHCSDAAARLQDDFSSIRNRLGAGGERTIFPNPNRLSRCGIPLAAVPRRASCCRFEHCARLIKLCRMGSSREKNETKQRQCVASRGDGGRKWLGALSADAQAWTLSCRCHPDLLQLQPLLLRMSLLAATVAAVERMAGRRRCWHFSRSW